MQGNDVGGGEGGRAPEIIPSLADNQGFFRGKWCANNAQL
jgi:hypothetical protein